MIRSTLTFCLTILLLATMATSQPKQKGKAPKKRFVPWSILERDGKKLCPLCGEEHEPKDFAKFPPRLSLSVWHPNNLDPDYFENRIASVSSEDLYKSIDWKAVPGQKAKGTHAKNYAAAIQS